MKHVLLPDGRPSWARRWHDWLDFVPRRPFFAELLECGFFLARPSFSGLSLESGARQVLGAFIDWIRGTEPGVAADDLGLDAIFFCHSPAPRFREPVRALAREARDAGYRCLVWHDKERELFLPGDASGEQAARHHELLEEFLSAPLSPGRRLKVVARAILQTLFVLLKLVLRRQSRVRDLKKRPVRIFSALVDSGLHVERAETVLDATSPGLLFTTHERFRPASSFWLARHRPRPVRVLYHHGLISWYEQPLLSDDVLSWNPDDANELRTAAPFASVHVTGNWELAVPLPRLEPVEGPPHLLFLSQYLRDDEPIFAESTIEALAWLREVARRCPEWRFLVKPRGPEDEVVRLLAQLPRNIEITHSAYDELLARPSVKAVAAFTSSGLYVAAGRGKRAIRLRVRNHCLPVPVIDAVSTPVDNPRDWERVLKTMGPFPLLAAEFFPGGSQAVEQAARVCLAKLAASSRARQRVNLYQTSTEALPQ